MKTLRRTVPLAIVLLLGNVSAEVVDAEQGGFTTVNAVTIDASRDTVWRAAINVGQWWSSAHTISGDASRLSINATPQGCFCESFGEGTGVVHLTVTMVNPGVILRLTGGLGPLVLRQVSIDGFSELGSGWAQGTSRRQWLVLAQRRNNANDRFLARPKGATQMIQYGVTALEKDHAISCGLRLALDHLGSSEPINTHLSEY